MAGDLQPDDKDWTWVLDTTCPECGFDVTGLAGASVAGLIRDNAAEWAAALEAPPELLRARPTPDRWSTLEYAAHVRDVCRLCRERLMLMLADQNPLFANWNQDATAVAERYNEQDPAVVRDELAQAAAALADAYDSVEGAQWQRTGRRSDGAVFTVESFARYLIHDPVHHLWDISEA